MSFTMEESENVVSDSLLQLNLNEQVNERLQYINSTNNFYITVLCVFMHFLEN